MTVLFYVLQVICSVGQNVLGKGYTKKGGSQAAFNVSKALGGGGIFLVLWLVSGEGWHLPTVAYAAGYGVFLCLSMYAGLAALASGPMALTSVIASMSFLIPAGYAVLFLNERLSVTGWIGVGFAVLAVWLLCGGKSEGKVSGRWLLLAFLTMAANGACSVVQKLHQTAFPGAWRREFVVISFFVVLLLLPFFPRKDGEKPKSPFTATGLLAGALNAGANYIVLALAAAQKAAVLFSTVGVVNVLAVWLVGRLVFRETLTRRQVFGAVIGVAAVLFFGL